MTNDLESNEETEGLAEYDLGHREGPWWVSPVGNLDANTAVKPSEMNQSAAYTSIHKSIRALYPLGGCGAAGGSCEPVNLDKAHIHLPLPVDHWNIRASDHNY